MTKRRVVQIAVTGVEDDAQLFALCDDGTLWRWRWWNTAMRWERVPDVPDDEGE